MGSINCRWMHLAAWFIVIDIHPCNRLVHIEKNSKLQMPLCIPLKEKTEMIRDKTLLSIVPGSTMSCDSPLPTIMSTALTLSGFRKSGKCLSSHFVFINESVTNFCESGHCKVQSLVTMAMQQRDVVESFLRHGGTKKCFESSQARKASFCCTTCDRQSEIQSQEVHNFWQHLRPDFVVFEHLHDVTDACNDNWWVR